MQRIDRNEESRSRDKASPEPFLLDSSTNDMPEKKQKDLRPMCRNGRTGVPDCSARVFLGRPSSSAIAVRSRLYLLPHSCQNPGPASPNRPLKPHIPITSNHLRGSSVSLFARRPNLKGTGLLGIIGCPFSSFHKNLSKNRMNAPILLMTQLSL